MDRNTPHPATGVSPAELLFGRPTRTKLPSIMDGIRHNDKDGEVRDNDQIFKAKAKAYADKKRKAKPSEIQIGSTVLVKQEYYNKLSMPYKDELFTVLSKEGGDVTLKSTETGDIVRRNVAHLKLYECSEMQNTTSISDEDDDDISGDHDEQTVSKETINNDVEQNTKKPVLPRLRINLNPIPRCTEIYPEES